VHRKSEIRGLKFKNSVVAPSGGVKKNLNMGAQLQIIPYKNPQNIFENCTD